MGSHLALALERGGHRVSVIDADPSAETLLGAEFGGAFVSGVAIDLEVLRKAGVDEADGLAAVTDRDETNLAVAMLARRHFRVPKVVAMVLDPSKIAGYRAAGIQVVCPTAWGFHTISGLLTRSSRETVATFGHGEVEVMELTLEGAQEDLRLRDVTSPPDIVAVALVRQGTALVPGSELLLEPGDRLYVRVPQSARGLFERIAAGLGV